MPHIVFDHKVDLSDFSKKIKPIFFKKDFLVKIPTIFIDKDNLKALSPTFVISKLHQRYFIEISTTQFKTTIRLLLITNPKKTIEVKESMVLVGKQILENRSNFKIIQADIPQANVQVLS